MNLLQKKTVQFFNYYSTYDTDDLDSDNKHSVIRLYGITTNNENVYIRIDNFPLFVYLELPNNIEWNKKNITILKDYFSNTVRSSNFKPTYQYFEKKKKLYDFQMGYNGNKYSDILYPFLFMCFKSDHAIKYFSAIVKKTITIPSLGKNLQFNMCLNERFNDPLLKFFSSRNLPTIGWIEAKGIVPPKEDIESSFPIELTCDYENIKRSDCKKTIFPKILTFDIETYSHNKNSMPDVNHPKDVVFQISYVINNPLNDKIKKVLLTLGKSNPITLDKEDGGDSVEILECKSEKELILKFSKQVKLENPNILCGYNIFGYDLNYLYKRAKYANIGRDFCNIGCISKDCTMKDFIMSSGAFGKNEMSLIDGLEGIIQIDLLPYVRRKYKLSTYTLENVAMTYLGTGKDPFKHHDIFAAYEAMTLESIHQCGKYCVVDSLRTYQLFQKMTVWFDLCESAEIQNVGIMVLFTQGTQICMYSQVLRYCLNNNFVYQPNPHNDSVAHITGAIVLDPVPGLYDNIFSFDFASLYPSIIISHNICFTTYVTDPDIPNDHCHCIDFDEHINCEHDDKKKKTVRVSKVPAKQKPVTCASYHFRFIKEEYGGKGIIPSLIVQLLASRKNVREEMKLLEKELKTENITDERKKEIKLLLDVMECRQLSYKVSANSMYGALGASVGYLIFYQGAMSVTYIGRTSLKKVVDYVPSIYPGTLVVYGDTDSVFLRFPQLEGKNNKESFDFCYKLSEELKKLFLSPMKMEFEGKKYSKFLILRKKMYCLIVEDINGIQGETKSKGLITSRRDNCSLARNIFKNLVTVMMNELIPTNGKNIKDTNKNTIDRILYIINNDILSVFNKFNLNTSKPLDFKDLIIVKTIKNNIENYKAKTLPAHVQLAKKLKERGIDVPVNTRIEYLFINCEDEKALQGKRIEELEYYESHKSDYKIDFLYYIEKQLIMPLDRVLKVACGIDNYVFDLWRYHTMKYNINKKIEEIFDPFTIIDADSKKKISMMKKIKRKKVIKV